MTAIKLGKYKLSWKALILIGIAIFLIYMKLKSGDQGIDLLDTFRAVGLK